jgi:hypothetical protein
MFLPLVSTTVASLGRLRGSKKLLYKNTKIEVA